MKQAGGGEKLNVGRHGESRCELADDVYEVIIALAAQTNQSIEAVVLEWLRRSAPKSPRKRSSGETKAAEQRFRRHFGAINSGNPRSADNAQIDADLAREYGDPHLIDRGRNSNEFGVLYYGPG